MYHCKSGKLAATSQKFCIFRETDESEISQKKRPIFRKRTKGEKMQNFWRKLFFCCQMWRMLLAQGNLQ